MVRVEHDARGLVTSIGIDGHAPLLFDRDTLGREVRRASAAGFRLDQAWDAVGQLRNQSAGHGPPDLDGLGAAKAKAEPGTASQRHYAWDRAGAPVGVDDLLWGATQPCCSDPVVNKRRTLTPLPTQTNLMQTRKKSILGWGHDRRRS